MRLLLLLFLCGCPLTSGQVQSSINRGERKLDDIAKAIKSQQPAIITQRVENPYDAAPLVKQMGLVEARTVSGMEASATESRRELQVLRGEVADREAAAVVVREEVRASLDTLGVARAEEAKQSATELRLLNERAGKQETRINSINDRIAALKAEHEKEQESDATAREAVRRTAIAAAVKGDEQNAEMDQFMLLLERLGLGGGIFGLVAAAFLYWFIRYYVPKKRHEALDT